MVWLLAAVPPPTVTFCEPCLKLEPAPQSFLTARSSLNGKERYINSVHGTLLSKTCFGSSLIVFNAVSVALCDS